MEEDNLLEILFEERMEVALDWRLATDVGYLDSCKEIEKKTRKLKKTKLNKKQSSAVDDVLSAQNYNSSEYGRAAYRQGFKDCQILLQELDRL